MGARHEQDSADGMVSVLSFYDMENHLIMSVKAAPLVESLLSPNKSGDAPAEWEIGGVISKVHLHEWTDEEGQKFFTGIQFM